MPKTFTDLLDSYVSFSNEDRDAAIKWEKQLGNDSRTIKHLASGHGGGMGSIPLQVGNVDISLADGVTLHNPKTGARSIYLDPSGDAWFGSDTNKPATTTMFVISNDQTYNSEAFGRGDLLVGDNSTGKANMFWDASDGELEFRTGQTVAGKVGVNGIDFTLGSIGGWNFDADKLYHDSNDIIMHGTNGTIQVGSGSNYIFIDGPNDLIKSSNFSAGEAGWQIDEVGDAEFNSITARGTFRSSVFNVSEISAVAGQFGVFKSASTVSRDAGNDGFVDHGVSGSGTDVTFYLYIRNSDLEATLITVGDIIRIKAWNGTTIIDVWARVFDTDFTGGVDTRYQLQSKSGFNVTLLKDMAVVSYGESGSDDGVIMLAAAETDSPRIQILQHQNAPWSSQTEKVVLGNMRDSYGTGANNQYGIGVGDYASGNYMSYNAEVADGLVIQAGGGNVTLHANGIDIVEGSDEANAVDWLNSSDVVIGSVWSEDVLTAHRTTISSRGDRVNDNAEILLGAWADSGDSASITLDASATSINNLVLYSNSHAYWSLPANKGVSISGGLYVGSGTIPTTMAAGEARFDGDLYAQSGFIVRGAVGTPSNGPGWEIEWDGTYADMLAYDRGGVGYIDARYRAASHTFNEGTTTVLTINNSDVFTNAWTNYAGSSTITGWSSRTYTQIYYKRLGKIVHVQFRIVGTSNSTACSFSLPFTNGPAQIWGMMLAANAGTWGNGSVYYVGASSSNCVMYWYVPTGPWTASGIKQIQGQFWYHTA